MCLTTNNTLLYMIMMIIIKYVFRTQRVHVQWVLWKNSKILFLFVSNFVFLVTRSNLASIMEKGFKMPKVKIIRKAAFERTLLLKFRPTICRRMTIHQDKRRNAPKSILKSMNRSLPNLSVLQQQQQQAQVIQGPMISQGTVNISVHCLVSFDISICQSFIVPFEF